MYLWNPVRYRPAVLTAQPIDPLFVFFTCHLNQEITGLHLKQAGEKLSPVRLDERIFLCRISIKKNLGSTGIVLMLIT